MCIVFTLAPYTSYYCKLLFGQYVTFIEYCPIMYNGFPFTTTLTIVFAAFFQERTVHLSVLIIIKYQQCE